MDDLKFRLDPEAFEKLKEVIKRNTNIDNINKDNIDIVKQAITMLKMWIESVYNIDSKELINDEQNIDQLFKIHN